MQSSRSRVGLLGAALGVAALALGATTNMVREVVEPRRTASSLLDTSRASSSANGGKRPGHSVKANQRAAIKRRNQVRNRRAHR